MTASDPAITRIHLIQGECRVSRDPHTVLTTTLGSCVSACLRDPEARIGGMNHFLLPGGDDIRGPEWVRYGAYAMELLVNGLLRSGARRERLEAKLFGGARLSESLIDVGDRNAAFAEEFLAREGIAFIGGSLRGNHARRIQFWPESGRVRQLVLARAPDVLAAPAFVRMDPRNNGVVELF